MQLCKSVSFRVVSRPNLCQKSLLMKDINQFRIRVVVSVHLCARFVSVRRTAFPWSWSSAGQQKKPDSEPSRRSIVEERIPSWLCKLKPSIAEQAQNQHGLQFVPSAWLVAL